MYNAKKPYKQTKTTLSFERAQMENTNTWLATLLPERTNEKGTLILNAGKPNILEKMVIQPFRGIEIENFPWPVPTKHSLPCLNKAAEEIL